MIRSYEDYRSYLEADRLALGCRTTRPPLFGEEIWRFQILLRKMEYYRNCRHSFIYRPSISWTGWKFHAASLLLGFTIPLNVFGPGLSIAHRGTIVVHPAVRIGANCRIHACVNIGTKAGAVDLTPVIGDNVYIGPGAKIFGDIRIADGIVIGANSVVNRSFEEPGISIAGIPARKISDKGNLPQAGETILTGAGAGSAPLSPDQGAG